MCGPVHSQEGHLLARAEGGPKARAWRKEGRERGKRSEYKRKTETQNEK